MNTYRLFTRSGQQFFVRTNNCERAIAKIESDTKDFVSCWFILGFGDSIPKHATVINA